MKPDPKIRAIARPLRIAYLIEDGPDTHRWLDSIFGSCMSRYGGRHSLVVPVEDNSISERYADWLRTYDPDIAFALTYDNAALVGPLVKLLADTEILGRDRSRDTLVERPDVRLREPPLTALSWLPLLHASAGAFRPRPERILDAYPRWIDDGFIVDNFGTLSSSLDRFPLHRDLASYVRPLVLTPSDAPPKRWQTGILPDDEIQSGYEMLRQLTRHGSLLTLGYLSNLASQRFYVEHGWRHSFCLVVGDSFLDRVTCWNAALLFDDAQHQAFKTLRVPTSAAATPEHLERIGEFLRGCNWIDQGNGPPKVSVRSHSVDKAELDRIAETLRGPSRSSIIVSPITQADECCPSDAKKLHWVRLPDPDTSESALGPGTVPVAVRRPRQLEYCSTAHPLFSAGDWYLDLTIDRLDDHNRASNLRDAWSLPSRAQLLRLFHDKRPSRILRGGRIGIAVNKDLQTVDVTQPDDAALFHYLLNVEARYATFDLREQLEQPVAYKDSQPSDKGRFLQGVLGLFGSLSTAEHYLGNHFWRSCFLGMATPSRDQRARVVDTLQRRLKAKTSGTLHIADPAGWDLLADRVIQMSGSLKAPRYSTRYKKLLEAWQAELALAVSSDQNLAERSESILGEAAEDLNRSLAHLCQLGVFYRGHEWVCRHCSHRNWASLDRLKTELPCEVCQRAHLLPVDLVLDFRLNEFLGTCLREHDTLSMVWALSELRRKPISDCFIFAPQMALFREYPDEQRLPPSREVDLLCIVDGEFIIGEIKQSVAEIKPSDIQVLAQTAVELNADVAVLAALTGAPGAMNAKVATLKGLLPAHVKTFGLISDWDDAPSAYL